jgi:hypothetical protein
LKNSVARFMEKHPGMLSVKGIGLKYGVNKCRMAGIVSHPANKFPEPELTGFGGRLRLYRPETIETWLNGRDFLDLPYLKGVYGTQNPPRAKVKEETYRHGYDGWRLAKESSKFFKALDSVNKNN